MDKEEFSAYLLFFFILGVLLVVIFVEVMEIIGFIAAFLIFFSIISVILIIIRYLISRRQTLNESV